MSNDDNVVEITAGGRKVRTTLGDLGRAAKAAAPEFGKAEPTGFVVSDEVAAVAAAVIAGDPRFRDVDQAHGGLYRVGYALLWGEDPESQGGLHAWAKCIKAPRVWANLGPLDLVVMVNQRVWAHLSEQQRKAIVTHELLHVGVGETGPKMLDHDIEEFAMVARQYGPWSPMLANFVEQLRLGLPAPAARP